MYCPNDLMSRGEDANGLAVVLRPGDLANVTNLNEFKQARDLGKLTCSAGASAELRFAVEMLNRRDLVLGGVTEQGEIDTSLYRWTEDCRGSRWQIQSDKAIRAEAQHWMTLNAADKVSGHQPKSCVDTMVDLMVHHRRFLKRTTGEINLVSLRNAYLIIDADGTIRAVAPDKELGVDYAIQTDLDWSRVVDGVYTPGSSVSGGYWHGYINSTFADQGVHDFTQEALSSILLSRCFEKGIWLFGEGENGKSVMIHILRSLAPQNTASVRLSRLTKDQFGTAAINGKRLIVVPEMPSRLDREMQTVLKGMISWDPTPCEKKGKDEYTVTPHAVWVFATNHHPDISDHEHGFHRKIETIPFTQRVSAANKIYDLHKLISNSSTEMAQVIDWLLIGAVRLTKRGRWLRDDEKPEAIQALARQQRRETDTVADWLHESELVFDDGVLTNKQAIYDHYNEYVHCSGKKPVAANKFWGRIKEQFRENAFDSEGTQKSMNGKRVRFVSLQMPDVRPEFNFTRQVVPRDLTPAPLGPLVDDWKDLVQGHDLEHRA